MNIWADVLRAREDKTIQSTASAESVDIANHAVDIIWQDLTDRVGFSPTDSDVATEIQNVMARAILLAMMVRR